MTPVLDTATEASYQLRVHPRARHINLRVTPADGLIVTVPRRCRPEEVDQAIRAKRDWIERSLAWAARERQRLAGLPPAVIPAHIDLPAVGENWTLELKPTTSRSARVIEAGYCRLRLSGPAYDSGAASRALRRWLARRARLKLGMRLDLIAARHGFSYGTISVRNQRSCWASCSPAGDISLNLKLLFLPPRLADYVLTHELCHTVHMNHSRRFWRLVGQLEPEYAGLKRSLSGSWDSIPAWVSG